MEILSGPVYKFVVREEEIIIRQFIHSDPVSDITNLLHSSYKQLADLGFRYLATHQDDSETKRRLNAGTSFIALSKEKIIATVSLYYSSNEHNAEWYKRKEVAHFGQFAVAAEYQEQGLGSFMMDIIERKAKELGAAELALDTAEGAAHLISYYEKRGYRFIEYVHWSVTNYRSVIMSKNIN